LNNAANPYLQTASSLKYSPLGTQSTSQSTGNSASSSVSSDPGSGGSKSPQQQQEKQPQQQGGGGSGGGGGGSGGGGTGSDGSGSNGSGSNDGSNIWDNGTDPFNDYGLGDAGSPYNSAYPGDGIGASDAGSSGYPYADGSSMFGQDYSNDGWGGGYGGGAGSYADASDFSGGGGGGGGEESYAGGGAIPEHSGPVPASMSPSGGQRVDDVRAQGPGGARINLNADEFVIPRDVALYKGQEFFQKLIASARKNNAMAAAKPRINYGGQHAAR
jgi:hypothetical protein